jgi:ankyrin repeat protein
MHPRDPRNQSNNSSRRNTNANSNENLRISTSGNLNRGASESYASFETAISNTPAKQSAYNPYISQWFGFASINNVEEMKPLVQFVRDINVKDAGGNSALFIACRSNAFDVAQWLLTLEGITLNDYDSDGQTPLHLAVITRNITLVRLLLLNGAFVNSQNRFGWTPLMIATYDGQLLICQLLVSYSANVHLVNMSGANALQLAMDIRRPDIYNFLLNVFNSPLPVTPQRQDPYDFEMPKISHNDRVATLQRNKTMNRSLKRGLTKRIGANNLDQYDPRMTNLNKSKDETRRMMDPSYKKREESKAWSIFAKVITFWAPSFILRASGKKDKGVQQAWREKIALCFIILLMSGFLAFISFGLSKLICKAEERVLFDNINPTDNFSFLRGRRYKVGIPHQGNDEVKMSSYYNQNINYLFRTDVSCPSNIPGTFDFTM